MINILSEAASKIREYLDDPAHRDAYVGATRKEIEVLLAEMERIRRKLGISILPSLNIVTRLPWWRC